MDKVIIHKAHEEVKNLMINKRKCALRHKNVVKQSTIELRADNLES